ncbi:hypothetical protein PVAP13_6KG186100 [Panicum virgatum]|uniref:Xyloglucan endotransglucosylase/hydrolase n=1 Tax=Panicum virgatum TaxID=38727 RepID=A0A8T0RC10_PANVG|nr:hypothetical protein PVAP13_6KG186100 [Panicum virgatum]
MAARLPPLALLAASLAVMAAVASADSWLYEKFNTDGTVRADYDASGQQVAMLNLDRSSGAGFNSKEQYLYGEFSPTNILFKVDGTVIRCFKRYDDLPYPSSRPMALHATLWDGSYWATEKGKVSIDWAGAPFVVSYRGYSADACVSGGACPAGSDRWMNKQPDAAEWGTVKWAESNYMRYNYCEDGWRFPQGLPAECSRS